MDASVDLGFRSRDFLERTAKVNGTGLPTLLALPRNGTIQCPIELEDARRWTKTGESREVAGRKPVATDARHRPRAGVEQHHARLRNVAPARDSPARFDDT